MVPVDCPKCDHQFVAKTSQCNSLDLTKDSLVDVDADCFWEEHGEPRKTILSSIKPRTDKPMIASLLLIIVVCIGVSSAFMPTIFLQGPTAIASLAGVDGQLTIVLDNTSVINASDITLSINQDEDAFIRDGESFFASFLELGEHEVVITSHLNNETNISKQVFIFPFNLSTYTIKITDAYPLEIEDATVELGWLMGILFILSMVTLIGAVMCWKRQHSDVAVIGSLVGIFTIGFYFSGVVLSVIAFLLILKSKDEFDDGKKGKSF